MTKIKKDYALKIALAATLTAIAVIVTVYTRIDMPIGGIPGLRISFHGPFVQFVSILLGPVFGGIAAAVRDLLGFFLRPVGQPWLWQLTLTEFLNGAAIAILWRNLKNVNINPKLFSNDYNPFFAILILLGFINLALTRGGETPAFLRGFSPAGIESVTYGLIITGVIGLFAVMLLRPLVGLIYKNDAEGDVKRQRVFKLFVAVGIPSMITTMLNSIIIFGVFVDFNVFPYGMAQGLMFFMLMRMVRRVFLIIYDVYILTVLIGVYEKAFKRKIG